MVHTGNQLRDARCRGPVLEGARSLTDADAAALAALAALGAPPDDETARITSMVEAAVAAQPPLPSFDPVEFRRKSDADTLLMRPPLDVAEDRTIQTAAGPLMARVFTPPTVRSVTLYIHGGAWMTGGRDQLDAVIWTRAQEAETAVVSIDYRLAPEHPWPAAADDCEAVALWLVDRAAPDFGTERLMLAGESAGAHLAVVTLLRLRDRHNLAPFCGAELRYGMYDLRLTPSARLHTGPVFDVKALTWVLDHVFPDEVRESPDASPLLADLRGLPPALFTVGTADSLVDDTLFMWVRWKAAGNQACLEVHPGAVHAFDLLPTQSARRAMDRIVAFVHACTG